MNRLLDRGIDINTTDTFGNNILMNLLNNQETFNTQEQINNMITNLVFNRRININNQNIYGYTALMTALENYDRENGSFEFIRTLLTHTEINLNTKNKDGVTALMLAVQTNDPDIVRLLLNYEADVNLSNNSGETAMDYTDNIEIINILINAGGTPTDYAIEVLTEKGALTERIKRLKNKEILENTIIPSLHSVNLVTESPSVVDSAPLNNVGQIRDRNILQDVMSFLGFEEEKEGAEETKSNRGDAGRRKKSFEKKKKSRSRKKSKSRQKKSIRKSKKKSIKKHRK
jgi:hypothetical protein